MCVCVYVCVSAIQFCTKMKLHFMMPKCFYGCSCWISNQVIARHTHKHTHIRSHQAPKTPKDMWLTLFFHVMSAVRQLSVLRLPTSGRVGGQAERRGCVWRRVWEIAFKCNGHQALTDAHCQNLSLGQHSCIHRQTLREKETAPTFLTPGLMSCQQPWPKLLPTEQSNRKILQTLLANTQTR